MNFRYIYPSLLNFISDDELSATIHFWPVKHSNKYNLSSQSFYRFRNLPCTLNEYFQIGHCWLWTSVFFFFSLSLDSDILLNGLNKKNTYLARRLMKMISAVVPSRYYVASVFRHGEIFGISRNGFFIEFLRIFCFITDFII